MNTSEITNQASSPEVPSASSTQAALKLYSSSTQAPTPTSAEKRKFKQQFQIITPRKSSRIKRDDPEDPSFLKPIIKDPSHPEFVTYKGVTFDTSKPTPKYQKKLLKQYEAQKPFALHFSSIEEFRAHRDKELGLNQKSQ
jgi:hypothetical protein